jgi:hypothetical protein
MPAYSYKRRFINHIRVGLGLPILPQYEDEQREIRPKRQTIRATGKRRHARPSETVQHYHGMRTRQCFKIGDGRCTKVTPIRIVVREKFMTAYLDGKHINAVALNRFAKSDGFENAQDMFEFWKAEHGVGVFTGQLIEWEPLT